MKIHVLAAIAVLGLTACGEEEVGTASNQDSTTETAEIVAVEPVAEQTDLRMALAENAAATAEKVDQAVETTNEAVDEVSETMDEVAQEVNSTIEETTEGTAEAVDNIQGAIENVTTETDADAQSGQAIVEEKEGKPAA